MLRSSRTTSNVTNERAAPRHHSQTFTGLRQPPHTGIKQRTKSRILKQDSPAVLRAAQLVGNPRGTKRVTKGPKDGSTAAEEAPGLSILTLLSRRRRARKRWNRQSLYKTAWIPRLRQAQVSSSLFASVVELTRVTVSTYGNIIPLSFPARSAGTGFPTLAGARRQPTKVIPPSLQMPVSVNINQRPSRRRGRR